jgi:F0F1-type ATP synthase membrane subunit b/b'
MCTARIADARKLNADFDALAQSEKALAELAARAGEIADAREALARGERAGKIAGAERALAMSARSSGRASATL